MCELIQTILKKIGPRKAGSPSELAAQQYLRKYLEDKGIPAKIESFQAPLNAHFSSLKIFTVFYVISWVIFSYFPFAAIICAIFNAVIFMGHFVSYGHWLDFLYKKQESWNLVAELKPKKDIRKVIILSAHMDSTPEFIWWYYLRDFGGFLTFLASILIVILPLLMFVLEYLKLSFYPVQAGIYLLSLSLLSLFFIHGKTIIPGVQDNLGGISVISSVISSLRQNHKEALRHTLVRLIAFGSEEPGLRGSYAYVTQHINELKKEKAELLNFDGLLHPDKICLLSHEINMAVSHEKISIRKMQKSMSKAGLKPLTGILTVGATDAASFSHAGISAISVIALPLHRLDATYHTRRDNLDCLIPETLEKARRIALDYIRSADYEAGLFS